MAAPRLALTVLVLMLAMSMLTEALRGSGPKKCCTGFGRRPGPKSKVESYSRTSQRCPFPAVILKMAGGRTLCAKPSAPWVKELIKNLDAKSVRAGETTNL